jgi:glutamine---fructose-6-phosphate transaminase (isomerizing)
MRGLLMEHEIEEQPSVLRRGAENYPKQLESIFSGRQFDMVLIAARGSSDNAALFARYLIEVHLGIPVVLAAPSVITTYDAHLRYPPCLAIGISQSGAAPDVAEVLRFLRLTGHTTLGITNTPASRIVHEAEFHLLLEAGAECSVAATKTYTASLLALYEVVRALGGDLPRPALPNPEWLYLARDAAYEMSGPVVRCNPVFALGRGYAFSSAHETALKLMECALIPCKAYSTADFQHGPKALAGHGSAAISFSGDLPELQSYGCEVLPAPDPGVDSRIAPLFQAIFGQWLALSCARARGLNPDGPPHLKKVTETT